MTASWKFGEKVGVASAVIPAKAGIQRSFEVLDSGSRFSLRLISRGLKLDRQLGRNDVCK